MSFLLSHLALLVLASSSILPVLGQAGTICVASVPNPTPGQKSLANPTGGGRTWEFSVRLDNGQEQKITALSAVRTTGLSLGARHLIRIRNKGTDVASFWFTFESRGSTSLCLWFNPLYETWSLWPLNEAEHLCECPKTS